MDDLPTPETFAPAVGQVFRVANDGAEAEFTLLEVRDHGDTAPPEGFRAPFSLLFDAPEDVTWGQGMFTYEHEAAGRHELFTTPVSVPRPGEPPTRYFEVVFG